ncbi:MAG: SDR family oxidoreductase [Deltaproteobacteria bacterium]|nr:SDR family oxidoreductase [Deltaproteobacteria bacterium]
MKTILITGGAGFLGSHLCRYFLEKNNKVFCVDNFLTGNNSNIEDLNTHPQFHFIHHNMCHPLYIGEKLDAILHFASPASPIDYQKVPIPTLKVGALGTHNALGLARAHNASILLASTSEVYGDPQIHPQKEDYWGHVNPIGPRGCYDEAKRFLEALTFAYHRTHKLKTSIVRIFNTYGPNMRLQDGRAVPNFISQALENKDMTIHGDGSQTRSFCYVLDLVEGIAKALEVNQPDPINLGNPQEMTVLQCAQKIIEATLSHSKIVFEKRPVDDPNVRRPDITRAKEILGWKPTTTLSEGLKKTIPYFKKVLSISE